MYKNNFLFLTIVVFFLNGCGSEQHTTVLKLAHVLDINHPVHKGMVFMAQKAAEKSQGQMRVDIYPGGQLGGERDLIELLQIGSLAMTKVSTAPLEAFVPEMKIFGIPYVFRDDEHRWKVLKSDIGKRLLLAGEQYRKPQFLYQRATGSNT
jgi:TRAP-type C4-dicarboxylate transport system substrate-binding protein